jgi:RNA polymerase sigma factor (sigma-70 family)
MGARVLRVVSRSASAAHPLEALYRAHYGFVWHAVRRFGVAAPLTDDAVQDTFITAYRRFDELELPTARAWLYGIARRVASNYRRADLRSTRKRKALAVATDAALPEATPPEAILALERFLAGLEPVDRELFVLSEIEGMTGPEAAAILALNTSTTYSRVQSLRRRFHESMVDRDPSALVTDAREQRPRATAHGWLLLAPRLGLDIAPKAAAIGSVGAFAKIAAVACGVTLSIVAVGTIARGAASPTRVETSTRESPTAAATAEDRVAPAVLPPTAPRVATEVAEDTPPARSDRSRSPAADPAPSLARDNALVQEAAAQLRAGDAADALATTSRHASEFPKSALVDARTALRIEALCALGKSPQARGEALVFLRERPATPVRARIERSCAGGSVDSSPSGQQGSR